MRGLLVALALLFMLAASASAQSPAPSTDSFTRAHRTVSTTIPAAQSAFDDGLTLLYAFNPEQARHSFQAALAADPDLAIAWWGVAMTYGTNINTDYEAGQAKSGHAAIARASAGSREGTPAERALIDAAVARFAHAGPRDGERSARAYRDAMVAVAERFPDDDDVQALTAEAGLDQAPWAYYNEDGTPNGGILDIVRRLQLVLARNPAHIGAEHFLIHASEESRHPEIALDAADRLAADTFEPGAEHLIHMPAHTYMRVGRYHDAGEANARAIAAYTSYLASDPAGHRGYFGHDCAFGIEAYMMSGEAARALAVSQSCASAGGRVLARLADVRFRDWRALEVMPAIDDFAGAMLAAHRNDTASANKHVAELNKMDDDTIKVYTAVLAAAVRRSSGDSAGEIASLRHAVDLQDHFGYSEPPQFFFPVRESLGGAYLRAGDAASATATFRADLMKNPDNPRSLYGLSVALERGGDANAARDARMKFQAAWSHADRQLTIGDL